MAPQEMNARRYVVYVDDNFHYMDEEERYIAGVYDTCEAATQKCKSIVNLPSLAIQPRSFRAPGGRY